MRVRTILLSFCVVNMALPRGGPCEPRVVYRATVDDVRLLCFYLNTLTVFALEIKLKKSWLVKIVKGHLSVCLRSDFLDLVVFVLITADVKVLSFTCNLPVIVRGFSRPADNRSKSF